MRICRVALAIAALLTSGNLQAQAATAWTPELAFTIKRVGTVAISPDARWAAVEVSQPIMDAAKSEWRPSIRICRIDRTDCAEHTETPASAPAWSPDSFPRLDRAPEPYLSALDVFAARRVATLQALPRRQFLF